MKQIVINALSVVVAFIADLIFHVVRFVIRLTTGKKEEEVSSGLEKNRKTVGAIALILIIAVSLSSILLTTFERQPPLPKVNLLPFQGIGQVMAEETSKLLDNQGEIVVLVTDTGPVKSKSNEVQLDAFNEALRKQPRITVIATRKIKVGFMRGMAADYFQEILQSYPDADALVSFVGAPELTEEQIGGLPQKVPKVIAISPAGAKNPNLQKLFEAQVVQMVIQPRRDLLKEGSKTPVTPREWFDQNYTIIKPENATSSP